MIMFTDCHLLLECQNRWRLISLHKNIFAKMDSGRHCAATA